MIYKSKITGVLMKLISQGKINKFIECDPEGTPTVLKRDWSTRPKTQTYITSSFKYLDRYE